MNRNINDVVAATDAAIKAAPKWFENSNGLQRAADASKPSDEVTPEASAKRERK